MKLSVIFVAALLALSGCASAPPQALQFVATPATTLAAPPPDKAQIVFVMPKNLFVESAVVGVYDVRQNDRTLLAMVPSHGKTVQLVTPGRHRFMTNFGAAGTHIMDADVVAGKRYYVLMRFIYGQGFQLRPIRASGPSDYSAQNKDFASWSSTTRFVEKTPEADTWYAANKTRVDAAQTASLAVWDKKTPQQQAELTLNAADAINE
jgi:hypothetical protein